MNDKLEITLKQGTYSKNPSFYQNFNEKQTITKEPGALPIESFKYYFNNNRFNIDENGQGLRVCLNPNKNQSIIPGQGILTYSELNNSIIEANDFLNDSGVDVNLREVAKIYRYDNSFDLLIDNSFSIYEPVIKTFESNIRQARKRIEGNSFYFGNKKNEIVIYDKTKESVLNYNDLRIETRNYHARLALCDLNEKNYYATRFQSKNLIMDSFFKNVRLPLDSMNNFFNEVYDMFFKLLESGGSKSKIEKQIGLITIGFSFQKQGKTPVELLNFPTHSKLYRQAYELRRDLLATLALDSKYIFDLYNELKTKFSKAV